MDDSSLDAEFVDLLSRHQGQIFGYIFAAVRNLDDAEELYQQSSLVLWRKFAHYRPGSDFARWACKVARYEILHFRRSKRRSPILFSEKVLIRLADAQASESEDGQSGQQHQELVAECVDELPPADRQLVQLCYGKQCSIKQVAKELDCTAQTLYNSLSRIRRMLFNCVRLKQAGKQER